MENHKSLKFYTGTAGWSYKDWVPNFYPKTQTKEFDWLQFYSQYFNCVEVNASYYTYLNPKIVNGWLKKIEDNSDFLFTIKLHQYFTHKKIYTNEQIQAVKYNLNILNKEEKLGGLLIQFPYSFGFTEANMEYIKTLNEIVDESDNFVEVRHSSWNNKNALDFFSLNKLTLCTIDQPQIGQSVPFKPIVTNDKLYLRFHGRNEDAWKASINNFGRQQTYDQQNERYSYLYSPGELLEIDRQIKEVLDKVKKVFVIMNNHPRDDAVANAFELMHLLDERIKIKIPPTILKAYPRLEKISID